MIINCPNCQEECLAPDPPLSSDGIEVQCRHCQFSFTVRSHESEGPPERPTPSAPRDTEAHPPGDPLSRSPLPPPHTLQPIPTWMVQAYETAPQTQPSDSPDLAHASLPQEPLMDAQEPDPLTRPIHPHNTEEDAADIPLIVDDALNEAAASLQAEPHVPVPVSGGRREIAKRTGGRRNPGRWVLPGILASVGLCVILLLLATRSGQGVLQKTGDVFRFLRTFLPFQGAEEGTLNFSNYNSDFVSRGTGASPLFVIEGKVTNNHPKPCQSILVKGILFDERGKRSTEETAYCGNILTRKELGSDPEEVIRKRLQNPLGSSLSNLNLQPGKSIPFMLVFFDPPEKLSEFSIEIAGYNLQETPPE